MSPAPNVLPFRRPPAGSHARERVRVERMSLANLLSNAVKYGEPDAPIALDVTRARDEVRVAVSNRGAGIPAADLPHIFERFYRAADARDRRPGLGLGLAIAKAIVEAHGGRIWASSLPGVVTQVAFALPLGAPPGG